MNILSLSNNSDESNFCVVKLIENQERYYAEIFLGLETKKIEIKSQDYFKILEASDQNQKVKIYPMLRPPAGYVLEIAGSSNETSKE